MKIVCCQAPNNIAVIKYWGKDNETLNTPLNSSLSVTLDAEILSAKTVIIADANITHTRMWLNGQEIPLSTRILNVLPLVRALASAECMYTKSNMYIISQNSFPTSAGLASSAAGYACIVYTLAKLYSVPEVKYTHLSAIARQGSGSACRSMFGGFVKWDKGSESDGSDSRAIQIASENDWPELCAIICVAEEAEKKVCSTFGMRLSKETSALLKFRTEHVVDLSMKKMEDAIHKRDFTEFATIMMKDSNQFHAICMDTFPPIVYLHSVSHRIMELVHAYNNEENDVCVAYTFDAGPNAVLFTTLKHVNQVIAFFEYAFSATIPKSVCTSIPVCRLKLENRYKRVCDGIPKRKGDRILHLYVSRVGKGPTLLCDRETNDGLVKQVVEEWKCELKGKKKNNCGMNVIVCGMIVLIVGVVLSRDRKK